MSAKWNKPNGTAGFQVPTVVVGTLIGWALLGVVFLGCAVNGPETRGTVVLPADYEVLLPPLVIRANRKMTDDDPVLKEILARREDVADRLMLPAADDPIEVYVFDDSEDFRWYLRRFYSELGDRRAIFVMEGGAAKVFTYWQPRLAEDLRHELTHAYLHSVIKTLPLWIDEGIAEYFEVEPGRRGFHAEHVFLLADARSRREWQPDLTRLDRLKDPASFTQTDYAESWLWIHYLIEHSPETRRLLQDYLAQVQQHSEVSAGTAPESENTPSLSQAIQKADPLVTTHLLEHHARLVDQL